MNDHVCFARSLNIILTKTNLSKTKLKKKTNNKAKKQNLNIKIIRIGIIRSCL
jgi:hypothetical protein